MKILPMSSAVFLAVAMVSVPALADDQPSQKAPTKTMGDEGKLPATGTMNEKVQDMGATGPSSGTSGTGHPKGGQHRMGNEGKLPATGTVGGALPETRAPSTPDQ
jgi:hypothetical protein